MSVESVRDTAKELSAELEVFHRLDALEIKMNGCLLMCSTILIMTVARYLGVG